jgi:molybdate transport system regulatory protein
MNISARNVLPGTITACRADPISAAVEVLTAGGDKIVAIVTSDSVAELALAPGMAVEAIFKAPWVMLLNGTANPAFSARNQLTGTVQAIQRGGVNTEVALTLPGGAIIHSVVTNEAVLELGLRVGDTVTALIKASDVILGLPA